MSGLPWSGVGVALLALVLAACQAAVAPEEDPRRELVDHLVAEVVAARDQGHPAPLLDRPEMPLDPGLAYEIQDRTVRQRLAGDLPAGFKLGLTTASAREAFEVDAPVTGVLWTGAVLSPREDGRYTLSLADAALPMIELELGFELAEEIDAPLTDPAELRQRVAGVRPVLELPDLDFEPVGAPTGLDLIAHNVATWRYVSGPLLPESELPDLNTLRVSLYHEGEPVLRERAGVVMDDQWQALLWLVNALLERGWTLQPGQLLITGAIGPMLPLRRGEYRADFGPLGALELRVTE